MTAIVPRRRFETHFQANPAEVRGLRPDHPAVVEGRTLFPTTVVDPRDAPRLLVSGINQRKLGDRVTKGKWRGMPIYSLTLEERATCPRSCHHWGDCMGNGMPFSRRHKHGLDLETRLAVELTEKQTKHPGGFVVRLHILGDFYSARYVDVWREFLGRFPALHCFGYTAWPATTKIGRKIEALREEQWGRFAIRRSTLEAEPRAAVTVRTLEAVSPGIVMCPAQELPARPSRVAGCGACGICWASNKPIGFALHGGIGRKKRANA